MISNASFEADAPDIKEVAKSIPFLGVLMGLTYIGHGVWVFEGTASTVESAKLPVLLGIVQKAGTGANQLEFPN